MTDEGLKILSFDLIRHYLRNFENEDTYSEQAMYVKGVVDLYTTIDAYVGIRNNKEEQSNAGTN